MHKQRVLIVHNYYQTPGGEDTVVANEKKMLEDNGHKVFMYTRHNDEIKNRGILGKLKLPFETIYSFKTKREVKRIIKDNKIDIVHVHNTLPLISPSVYWAAKECGIKVVQTIHNFRFLCPAATFVCKGQICEKCLTNGLKCAVKNKCYRDSRIQTLIVVFMLKINRIIGNYSKVDSYIALTKFSKNKMSKFICEDKIMIKPNFTEKENIEILSAQDRKYFIFVGRLDKLKGIEVLLNTWKDIKNEKLLIVGTGPEEENIKKFIELNKINNIELYGSANNFEVKKLISEAKSLIMPSICYETFGMVNIEAFSVGTPVIASEIGALNDIVNNDNGMTFKPYSLEELRICINKFSNIETLSSYIQNVSKDYQKKYTNKENYKILLDIYKM